MVWDPSLPDDDTKLRNTPSVIQPNWQAIEEGDLSFQPNSFIFTDRNALIVTNDPPPAIAGPGSRGNGYTLYCKQDTDGNPALFGRDPSSVITQFTDSQVSLAQTGYAVIPPGILVHWGRVVMASSTSSAPVTFAPGPNYSATPWTAYATPLTNPLGGGGGANARITGIDSLTTTGFNVRLYNGNVTANTTFSYLVLGPR